MYNPNCAEDPVETAVLIFCLVMNTGSGFFSAICSPVYLKLQTAHVG